MKKVYQLDGNGRIRLTADVIMVGTIDGEVFDFPDDFDFCHQHEYKVAGGELVYDPPEADTTPTQEQRIAELEEALALLLSGVTE